MWEELNRKVGKGDDKSGNETQKVGDKALIFCVFGRSMILFLRREQESRKRRGIRFDLYGENLDVMRRNETMYRRYTQVNETSMPVSQVRRNRVRNIAILVLAAALIAVTAVAVPAVQRQSGARALYIQRMQNEIATAVRLTTGLSRNAGASSAAILAQVRSCIYSISTVNEISIGVEGAQGRLLEETELTSLQGSIDNFLQYLTTGMDTGEYQTNLQNALDALQIRINALN
jgi:hypothetical protein